MGKFNETQSWFIEKTNKIDKHLARLTKGEKKTILYQELKRKHHYQLYKNKRILRDYWEQLYTYTLNNLNEMNKLLERYKLRKVTQREIENLNALYQVTVSN